MLAIKFPRTVHLITNRRGVLTQFIKLDLEVFKSVTDKTIGGFTIDERKNIINKTVLK